MWEIEPDVPCAALPSFHIPCSCYMCAAFLMQPLGSDASQVSHADKRYVRGHQ